MDWIVRGRRLLVGCALALAGLALPAAQAQAAPIQAKSADALVDSMGVNVHITYTRGVYGRYDIWKPKLEALGIRHIRDGLKHNNPLLHSRLNDLAASGIKANVLMGDPKNKYSDGTLDQLLATLKTKVRGAVVSVEGPNEWDSNRGTYPCDPTRPTLGCWASDLRAYQQQLHQKVKADPALAHLPVLGPGFALGDRRLVGDLSPWLDSGNMHSYPGNRNPEWSLTNAGKEFERAAINSGSKPVMATETGYHNAVASTQGHRPVSERASGVYMPRLFLENFRQASLRGQTVKRTFSYELIDQGTSLTNKENRFGLLRNDFSEKPAYAALKNLTTLLEDRGPAFSPGALDYSLEGATSDVRSLLLQKRDGSFWLALWREVDVWNEVSGGDLFPGSEQVTLKLNRPVETAEGYRPGVSGGPLVSIHGTAELRLWVPADVVLVKLVPGGSPSTGRPAPAPSPSPVPAPKPAGGTPPTGAPRPPSRPAAPRPVPQRPRAGRRIRLDLGRARRRKRVRISWPAGRGGRYRVYTSIRGRRFRRAGVTTLNAAGRSVVRFRKRKLRYVRLIELPPR